MREKVRRLWLGIQVRFWGKEIGKILSRHTSIVAKFSEADLSMREDICPSIADV